MLDDTIRNHNLRPSATSVDYKHPATANRTIMLTVALTIAATAVQSRLQYWFYRGRVIGRWPIASNDGFVFGLPLLIALLAFSFIAIHALNRTNLSPFLKIAAGVASVLIMSAFSTSVAMTISFNTFGT
jgi:hypothetical protein